MSQKITGAKSVESKPITNSYGVKMLGVKMGEKGTSKKSRVFDSSDIDDEPIMFLDPKPLKMIVIVDISTDKAKNDATKRKKKMSKKVSTLVHDIIETMNVNMEADSKPRRKDIYHDEIIFEGPNVEPHVDQHVEHNVEAFVLTSSFPQDEPTSKPVGKTLKSNDETHVKTNPSVNLVMVDGHPIDTPVIDKLLDDVFNNNYVSSKYSDNDILNENHQNVEDEVQSKNG